MDLDFRRNLRRKHGSKSFWIWEGKVFLDTIPKAQVVKKQNKTQQLETVNFTKIKNLCPTNYTIKKVKDNPQNEREYFGNHNPTIQNIYIYTYDW